MIRLQRISVLNLQCIRKLRTSPREFPRPDMLQWKSDGKDYNNPPASDEVRGAAWARGENHGRTVLGYICLFFFLVQEYRYWTNTDERYPSYDVTQNYSP